MKKLLLTILILGISSVCFAGGSLPKQLNVTPDVLISDNPSWSGTKYNGKIAILNGSTIKLNRNYIKDIVAYVNDDGVLVRIKQGFADINPKCPNLPAQYHGKVGRVAYKTLTDQTKVWTPTTASVMNGAAKAEATGITINPANFKADLKTGSITQNPYQSGGFVIEKQPCYNNAVGQYPDYRVYFDVNMSLDEYATFKAEAQANGYQIQEVTIVDDGTQ